MTLKDNIIYQLEKQRGNFISGQEIAKSAGVSRNAVSKCINSLKSEGFLIESVNNCGHRLLENSNILSEYGIKAFLDNCDDLEIKVFKTIDSTNNEAKRAIANGLTSDAIFVSDHQTSGRGRRGRSFFSPEKSGLYFTAVLHPDASLEDSVGITAATAVVIADILSEITKNHPKIKWVNDIFVDNKKVCGILTEAVSDFESNRVQAVIIGIGINLTTSLFPDELSEIAGSVGEINRCYMAAEIYKRLKAVCANLATRSFMDDYRKYSLVIGKEVDFCRNGINYTAKAKNILDDGSLLVITDRGEEIALNGGEISVRLNSKN